MQSGDEKSTSQSRGALFAPPPLSPLPADIIKYIHSFLDPESQHRFALIKNNNALYTQLLHAALVNHFLQIVAEGNPPQYELSQIKPEMKLEPGVFYVDLPEEKETNQINYTVISPHGTETKGTITSDDLSNLNIEFPTPCTPKELKTILPDILEITAAKGDTYAMSAEKLLASFPKLKTLCTQRGNVTDFAGNHFTNITAFQYAVWAKDRHAWSMLQKNMTPEEVQKQLVEMKEDKFKSQHGSFWDCPKEYDLNYLVLDTLPSLEDLKNNKITIPTLIKILNKTSDTDKYYIYGNSNNGVTPQCVELDKTKIDLAELERELKQEKAAVIHISNTREFSEIHAEIEAKEGHFVNPLASALKEFVTTVNNYIEDPATNWENANNHLDDLWFKVGKAESKVPVHIVNEYCRHDRSFDPTPEFKEEILPRTRKLWDQTTWYPVQDNKQACVLYLHEVSKGVTLNEKDCKIPTLIKSYNKEGVPQYELYALDRKTNEPKRVLLEIKDENDSSKANRNNVFNKINFSSGSQWISPSNPIFTTLAGTSDLTFSRLGLSFGCFRRVPGGGRRTTGGAGARVRALGGIRRPRDLLAVSGLCHERTLETQQLMKPAVASEHKLT